MTKTSIKSVSDGALVAAYNLHGGVKAAAWSLGVLPQSLHRRIQKYNLATRTNVWSPAEVNRLKAEYPFYAERGRLAEFSVEMGRCKHSICRKARQLGMTDKARPRPYSVGKSSEKVKAWHKTHEHPRGMLGKKHTDETKERMGAAGRANFAALSEQQLSDRVVKMTKTKIANGTLPPSRIGASWKASWQEIGGVRRFYRSRWESNYARYLEWLKGRGLIKGWEHEPQTFWFEGIKRGCVSYLPDFRVTENDGRIVFHEVKGWMDDRSKTKISRMARYHPTVKLVVIDGKNYRAIAAKVGKLVPGWEAEAVPPSVRKGKAA